MLDQDPLLARLQRRSAAICAIAAVAALALTRGSWRAAGGVAGGGVLIAVSFLAIRGAFDRLVARRHLGMALVIMAGHYALLIFLAYVMIARLRLHPLGLVAGASSVVAAAALEAGRLLWKKH